MSLFTALVLLWTALLMFTLQVPAQQPAPSGTVAVSSTRKGLKADSVTPVTAPEKPQAPLPHAFWDRTNLWLFSGVAVTRALDYTSTRNMLARGREEILLPDDVVDNSAGFASLEAAGTMTSIGISYIFHRTGHHTLERWMSIGSISVTGFGAARNYALESRHPR